MRLLILGGTIFLGRHLTDIALNRGYDVTHFNRGQHNPDLFSQVTALRGDRDGDLSALEGRQWDAVIDTCGYVPRLVRTSAELLADAVEHYTFISTMSVYADPSIPNQDESAPVGTLDDETVEEITGKTYGPLKALCEQAAEESMPGRVLNLRPGLIVGPHDPTDRFTYWPWRVALGGEVLAPGAPDSRVQFIDVRDLAGWTLDMIAERRTGVFNVTGPDYPLRMERVLQACKNVTSSNADFTWVTDEFLQEHRVEPYSEMPLWVPEAEYAGFSRFRVGRARSAGLAFRPLPVTIRDTYEWAQTRPEDHQWRAGLPREREQELLDAWHTHDT